MVMTYELPPMRPPSEAYSLLMRVMRGCSWNKCTFCDAYKSMKFDKSSIRSVDDVKRDIETAKNIADRAKEVSWMHGYLGRINEVVRSEMAKRYGVDIAIFPWLVRDGYPKTAFLADSNAIVIKADDLAEMVEYLYQTFPSLERVTSYGRAKTVVTKSLRDLERAPQEP